MYETKLVKIKPMSFKHFQKKFYTDKPHEYMIYLKNNTHMHHYVMFETLEEWYKYQINI